MNENLTKPFEFDELVDTIERLVGKFVHDAGLDD